MSYGATPLNTYKLKLSSAPWNPNEWGKRATWEWDLVNNNPRLVVWCNNPKEAEKLNARGKPLASSPISAHMGPFDLFKFFNLAEKVCKSEKPLEVKFPFFGSKFVNDEKVKGERELKCTMYLGRSADGNIFMRMEDNVNERDVPELIFKENTWVPVSPTNGEFSDAKKSTLEFEAYISALKAIFSHLLVSHFVPDPPRDVNKGGKSTKKEISTDLPSGSFDDF